MQWTWAILCYSHNYIDENGQKLKSLNDLFKPSDVAASMNVDRKTNFLTILSSLII